MVEGLIGRKIAMTQVFDDEGRVVPCTVLRVGPCVIVQRREKGRDGYEAVQLGLVEQVKVKNTDRAMKGHFDKANVAPVRTLKEFRILPGGDAPEVGGKVLVTQFKVADKVDIVGVSKGKGFQGVMKRHHFRGGAASHGSMFHRAPGSIGASSFPSRVVKGMRAAGRMGGGRVTIHNLKVLRVDPDNHLLIVEGGIPGAPSDYVIIRKAVTLKKLKVAQVEKPKKGKK